MSTKNLSEAIQEHLTHLKEIGKRPSTVSTTARSLKLLEDHLGPDKDLRKILTVHVAGFFSCEAATTLRGKPRAEASILQIRRIVRQALVWWHEQGLIEKLPLPKDQRRFVENGQGTSDPEELVPEAEVTTDSEAHAAE